MIEAAFYCVADERYFLGAVGLINSLRLQGHTEPVFVLDLGMNETQRATVAAEATVVAGHPAATPWLSKTVAPLRHPARTAVLIDVDMIATRSVAGLIERAAGGRVIAFENDRDRFVPEWGELLDLGPMTRARYVSSGLVVAGGDLGAELIALLDDRQRRVQIERTIFGAGEDRYPFRFPEQDVLNAILCTRTDPSRIERLPNDLAPNPPFAGLRLSDPKALRCVLPDDTEPYVLHHFDRKPWLHAMYHGLYSRLLARLLLADDVAIRVPAEQVPLRLRSGPLARVERLRVDSIDVLRRHGLERIRGRA